jgi:hypothetical protein
MDADKKELLADCPGCGYSLRGLPTQHACPECGLAFDRRWQVFGGRARSKHSTLMGRFATGYPFVYTMAALVVVPLLASAFTGLFGFWWVLLVFGPVALFAAVFLRIPRAFVAVGPDGVLIYRGPKRSERFAWAEVGRARLQLFRKKLIVPAAGKDVRVPFTFFGARGTDLAEAERLLRCINHYPRGEGAYTLAPDERRENG